ncbi:DUF4145 domain-containing protein [Empedobacter brevis]|uniref:DUF4145 domain-containing protein n=1 Tax=Empedobacter brevis TaxID=247 RepID=UPI0028D40F09|nr:DUF4145 domain-containing protein [Empedobacter brevis]
MKSYCNICNRQTNQNILFKKEVEYSDEDHLWWEENIYQIIQCAGCDEITYRTLYTNAQMSQYADYENPYTQTLYPIRGPYSIPIKNFKNLPLRIKDIYRETIDAFNNNQIILCSAGLRALVEAICLEKGIKGINKVDKNGKSKLCTNLECKIDALHQNNLLIKENADSLHELRFLGNEALHELEKPSTEEITLAVEILELTLENIFELQHKALSLKEKKINRKK